MGKISVFWLLNDAKLRKLVADGATSTAAGVAIGVSKNSILSRARKLNLSWKLAPGQKTAEYRKPAVPEISRKPTQTTACPDTLAGHRIEGSVSQVKHCRIEFPGLGHCMFTEDAVPPFRWCGEHSTSIESAWCAQHEKRVFQRSAKAAHA
jgi:hypothetical protein